MFCAINSTQQSLIPLVRLRAAKVKMRAALALMSNTNHQQPTYWLYIRFEQSGWYFTDNISKRMKVISFWPKFHWSLICWGRVEHICISNLTIIGSDNGLSPGRRQAIIWTNDGILLIGPMGINFSEILIEIHTFFIQGNAFENDVCKMVSISFRPQCVKLS